MPRVSDSSTFIDIQPTVAQYWRAALDTGSPAALWRLPNRPEKHLIVHLDAQPPMVSADLEELPAGFAVSPYHNPDLEQTRFLRADVYVLVAPGGVQERRFVTDAPHSERFRQALDATVPAAFSPATPPAATPVSNVPDDRARTQYVTAAADAVAQMQAGTFRKVVLSRTKTVRLPEPLDVLATFDTLCASYPTAFISAVFLPGTNGRPQIWLSATPERLVSVDASGIFRTVSLAGTQPAQSPAGELIRPSDAMWSQKEIEEQALVSRYIIECFKKIRLREYSEEGPRTVVAGNLMHLRTDFRVDTQAVNFPQLGTVMLRLLHPTSAVCGMPRPEATAFIAQHEPHDRELYSGFLGPVNLPPGDDEGPESHLFVHIRCLKLEGLTATLYAGAGLTEDSIPEREWIETELKCQTLLTVLKAG